MIDIILIIVMIAFAANGNYTLCWISGGAFVLFLIGSLTEGRSSRPARGRRSGRRIDTAHDYDADEMDFDEEEEEWWDETDKGDR